MTSNNPDQALLKAAAEAWHEDGASIIPIHIHETANPQTGCYNKDCNSTNWGKWIKQPQTKNEFKSLNWTGKNGFAIILGYQDSNGYYLTVVDFDPKCGLVKPVYDEQTYQGNTQQYEEEIKQYSEKLAQHNLAVEWGRQLLADLPKSRVEVTVNGGYHVLFKSRQPVKTVKSVHNTCKIEVLTERQICIMAPSFGYKITKDTDIAIVDDFNQLFHDLCLEHNLYDRSKTPHSQTKKNLQHTIQRLQQQIELSDDKVKQIVEVFAPVWTQGNRHI